MFSGRERETERRVFASVESEKQRRAEMREM